MKDKSKKSRLFIEEDLYLGVDITLSPNQAKYLFKVLRLNVGQVVNVLDGKTGEYDAKIVEKIADGKLNKFINDNTLLNQEWIIDPKKKVKQILKDASGDDKIEIKKYIRFKVGEGI